MPHGQKPLSVMYFVILFKFYGIIILPDVPFCCVWWSKPAAHLRSGCVRLGSCGLPCSRCAFATLPSSKPKCRIPDRIEIWQGNLPKASRNYHKLHDYINVGILFNLNVHYLSLITFMENPQHGTECFIRFHERLWSAERKQTHVLHSLRLRAMR